MQNSPELPHTKHFQKQLGLLARDEYERSSSRVDRAREVLCELVADPDYLERANLCLDHMFFISSDDVREQPRILSISVLNDDGKLLIGHLTPDEAGLPVWRGDKFVPRIVRPGIFTENHEDIPDSEVLLQRTIVEILENVPAGYNNDTTYQDQFKKKLLEYHAEVIKENNEKARERVGAILEYADRLVDNADLFPECIETKDGRIYFQILRNPGTTSEEGSIVLYANSKDAIGLDGILLGKYSRGGRVESGLGAFDIVPDIFVVENDTPDLQPVFEHQRMILELLEYAMLRDKETKPQGWRQVEDPLQK